MARRRNHSAGFRGLQADMEIRIGGATFVVVLGSIPQGYSGLVGIDASGLYGLYDGADSFVDEEAVFQDEADDDQGDIIDVTPGASTGHRGNTGAGPYQLENYLPEDELNRWCHAINRRHPQFRFRQFQGARYNGRLRRTFGRCFPSTGWIEIAPWMARAPRDVYEVLLVHELAHLRHPDHGPGFMQLVNSVCPDYHRLDQRLDGYLEWLDAHDAKAFASRR